MVYVICFLLGIILSWGINGFADGWPFFRPIWRAQPCTGCAQPLPPTWLASWRYVRLRARCSSCGQRLPLRPVLVELAMAFTVPLLVFSNGLTWQTALHVLYFAAGILIIAIDSERLIIPNRVVYPMILVATAASLVGFGPPARSSFRSALIGGAVALTIFLLFFVFGAIFARLLGANTGPGLGFGDVKLAALVGLIVGYPGVINALTVTVIAGAVVAAVNIVWRLLRKSYKPGKALPYGPFLVFGAFWTLFIRIG